MQLTTLVGLLERDQPGIRDLSSTRGNLARLYAERGQHKEAVEQFRIVRDAARRPLGQAKGPTAQQATAAIAASLFEMGKLDAAKQEAKRALASGVSPKVADDLERIIAGAQRALPASARGAVSKPRK